MIALSCCWHKRDLLYSFDINTMTNLTLILRFGWKHKHFLELSFVNFVSPLSRVFIFRNKYTNCIRFLSKFLLWSLLFFTLVSKNNWLLIWIVNQSMQEKRFRGETAWLRNAGRDRNLSSLSLLMTLLVSFPRRVFVLFVRHHNHMSLLQHTGLSFCSRSYSKHQELVFLTSSWVRLNLLALGSQCENQDPRGRISYSNLYEVSQNGNNWLEGCVDG